MSANPLEPVDSAVPHPQRPVARKLTRPDVPAVSAAMARAFFDDPVVGQWCLADESTRMDRLERMFEMFLRREYLRHDECYTVGQTVGGAFWLPPGTWKLTVLEELQLLAQIIPITRGATPRLLRVLSFIEAKHPHQPHYYLPLVGIEPGWQRKGFGSAMIEPVLGRCDDEGMPAYLEATSERNRALYGRHGFELVEKVALPGGGPPIWRMWREPV